MPKGKALKNGDIGVENAAPADIVEALENAHCTGRPSESEEEPFTKEDLFTYRLAGTDDAKERREKLGNLLSIGYGNSKTFLKKLNQFNITKEEFLEKIRELG